MAFVRSLIFALITLTPFLVKAESSVRTTLSGRVINLQTGEPLAGATIYFPDLKTGTVSGQDGYYRIDNLPKTKALVQVTYVGFQLIAKIIDLETTNTMDFSMSEAVNELNEIVVSGLSKSAERNRTPTPVTTIPHTDLLLGNASNIVDAMANQPGVSQITTGAGISKPVIRGLGYNRVLTIMDGIRQEGHQWGDEHGIEVDEFAVHRIEILKGPASLAYGSDAMAGVIHFLSSPTVPEGQITGDILVNYQTNNGLLAYSFNATGNEKGIIWDLRYSNKKAHSYQNKFDGYVFNSGFKENSLAGILGLNKSWGYAHLHLSAFHSTPGIIEGERDSITGEFVKSERLNDSTEILVIADNVDFKNYTPQVPFQEIHHYKAVLNNSFILGDASLKATLGWQQNHRKEFDDVLVEDQYGLYFLLDNFHYDVRYVMTEEDDLSLAFGFNGMLQMSQNKGSEYLIPEYDLFDAGVFVTARKTFDQLDISGGLRFDWRNEQGKDLFLNEEGIAIDPDDPNAIQRFKSFHKTFTGISGSLGATYQFSELVFTKLNLSRGFRAANIAEISANGVHEGTINYIIGNPGLDPETSLQLDYALGFNSLHVTAEANLFANFIQNYIFQSELESSAGGDSLTQGFKTFKYISGDARLTGGEITIDIHPHPLDWLHFENSFSYVRGTQANQPDSTYNLPSIPAPKWSSELKATAKKWGRAIANAYCLVELEYNLKQDKYYSAFGTETETPGYVLFNFGLGTGVVSKNATLFSVYFNIKNLFDVAYQSHLSRLKYAEVNLLTGKTGVFNPGRNFSIKMIIPLQF